MALRQHTVENFLNQENMPGKMATKSFVPAKGVVPKRAALGEVKSSDANKLYNLNNHETNVAKKGDIMGPPQVLSKKTADNVPIKKEISVRVPEKIPNSNNIKPVLKKQQRILKNIHIEEEKVHEPTKSYSSKQISIIDPDEKSKNEPQMVTEYLGDIFSYLLQLESDFPIRKHFLEGHKSTPKMRAILLNWIVEVHQNFKLYLETLHLCVAIIDRYLQDNKNVGRDTLQLVGTSAMVIASKYEEMYLPDMDDFVYISDDTFTKRQILRMECEILKKIDFSLGRPLSIHFLRRYNKVAQVRFDHHTLGKYLLELALFEYEMSHIKPSVQAAAACCLSMGILNQVMDLPKLWTPTLIHYTTYEYRDIKPIIIELAHLIVKSETSKYQSIRKKYASSTYAKISLNSKLNGPLVRKLSSACLTKK